LTNNIKNLENQIADLKEDKELTTSQEKLDFIDDQIFELKDTIKKLNGEK
tara:strand:- start:141 stop:290 length:150 start_codon:yes stop_codon:yes gene_type:complete